MDPTPTFDTDLPARAGDAPSSSHARRTPRPATTWWATLCNVLLGCVAAPPLAALWLTWTEGPLVHDNYNPADPTGNANSDILVLVAGVALFFPLVAFVVLNALRLRRSRAGAGAHWAVACALFLGPFVLGGLVHYAQRLVS